MKVVIVVGAGLSGLIAANLLRARGYEVDVFERQGALPDNHQAVLRFRSPALGEVLGIPFKRVRAILCVAPTRGPFIGPNPIGASFAYSFATTGIRRTDRSITRLLDGPQIVDRWIAPPDFREILLERIQKDVHFKHYWSPSQHVKGDRPMISTIPMNALLKMVKGKKPFIDQPEFQANSYVAVTADLFDMDAYGSMYNTQPSEHSPWTRISFTGSMVSMEVSLTLIKKGTTMNYDLLLENVLDDFFGPSIGFKKDQLKIYFSKTDRILPIPDRFRKAFIMHLTDRHNVYSLGRFATWRPGMLLDEIIQDTSIIASMIEGNTASRYEAAK